jgi:hypothetical protein
LELTEAVERQLREEIGDAELTEDQKNILQQKYGLRAPKFTGSERNLILREERKQGAKNVTRR